MKNYALGRNACAVRTSSPVLEGWEPCHDLETLQAYLVHDMRDIKVGVNWKGPKVPAQLLKNVLGTQAAFPTRETGYILYFSLTKREWLVECSDQMGRAAGVKFKSTLDIPGFEEVGTIHTHPDMGAFWSGTDMRDQKGQFGIHVVLGTRGGRVESSLCTIFTRLAHYNQELFDIFEEVDLKEKYPPVDEWVKTISRSMYRPPVEHGIDRPFGVPGLSIDCGWTYRGQTAYRTEKKDSPAPPPDRIRVWEEDVVFAVVKGVWPDSVYDFDQKPKVKSTGRQPGIDNAVVVLKALAGQIGMKRTKQLIDESQSVLAGTADFEVFMSCAESVVNDLIRLTDSATESCNEYLMEGLDDLIIECEDSLPCGMASIAGFMEDERRMSDNRLGACLWDDVRDDDDDDDDDVLAGICRTSGGRRAKHPTGQKHNARTDAGRTSL